MTKEEFFSGATFKFKDDKYTFYKFVPNNAVSDSSGTGQPGYLLELIGTHSQHHANVKKVTPTRFLVYTTICAQSVATWRNLSDFEII